MKVIKLTYNAFQENTYLLLGDNNECVIVDPGCLSSSEKEHISQVINQEDLNVVAVLNTHAHLDHIFGNRFVIEKFGVDLYAHKDALPDYTQSIHASKLYGFTNFEESPEPTKWLNEGDVLNFGSISLKVLLVPGHARGHVAFYNDAFGLVINGDVLFKGSYGRVDLPGGDFETLKQSILNKMFLLPDETVVYCGHGPETTIGDEKKNNPILF